jgi:DNA transposition AAA+ family ATPase
MENSVKQSIVDKTRLRMNSMGLSTNKASKLIGVNIAYLSNMLNGKWDSISDDKWNLLSSWAGARVGWQIAPTHNMKRVANLCASAQNLSISYGISDEAGTGKSAGLRRYAQENSNVVYVECDEYWSKRDLVENILRALGREPSGNVSSMIDKIIYILKSMEKPLVIFDEADSLRDGVFGLFKTLYNKTENSCGFVLAGGLFFRERLRKGCNKNKQSYKEIYSRIGGELKQLKPLQVEDVEAICLNNGVQQSELGMVISKMKNSKDLRVIKSVIEEHLLKGNVRKAA